MKTACLTLISFLVTVAAWAQPTFAPGEDPAPEGRNWRSVPELSDEFSGKAIDRTKWQTAPIGNDWGWRGRPPGLFLEDNITVRKGELQVEVGVLDAPRVIENDTFLYYGGIVRALHPGQPGWYYEARVKANRTEMSTTFWLMSKYDCERKQELDIQECVGVVSPEKADWVKDWDQIFHGNAIHRKTSCVPESTQKQGQLYLPTKNADEFYIYGCWWKSPEELRFYLNGKYAYSINPSIGFVMPA
ncbi:MAG: family 16 glycosylhydrolase, partial [Bacteroidota bacterium]